MSPAGQRLSGGLRKARAPLLPTSSIAHGGRGRPGATARAAYRYTRDDIGRDEEEKARVGGPGSSGWASGSGRANDSEDDDGYGGWSGGGAWEEDTTASFVDEGEPYRESYKEDEDGFGFADEWAEDAQDPSPSFDRDERGSERSSRRGGASSSNPNPLGLWPLRSDELHELFPLSGTPGQYSYYWGTWDQAVQRFALSLLVTLLATNSSSVVAAGAFTYSIWGPILQSMVRNLGVKKYPYGGYWEARILELSFKRDKGAKGRRGRRGRAARDDFAYNGENGGGPPTTTAVRVGKEGVADVLVELPFEVSHQALRPGDAAMLVVVSNSPSLSSFKAVRDIFLPETRQWLFEYPFVSRRGFQQVMDRVNYAKRDEEYQEYTASAQPGGRGY